MPTKEEMLADIERQIAEYQRYVKQYSGHYAEDMKRHIARLNRKRRRIERGAE